MDLRLQRPMAMGTVVGTSPSALRMVFLMQNTDAATGDAVAEWEACVLDTLQAAWPPVITGGPDGGAFKHGIQVDLLAERSFQDENDRAINVDLITVGLAVTVMIIYVTAVTGSGPRVRSRVLLGSSIVCVVFSLGAGFGLCGFMGVGFNQISQMCFFVLLVLASMTCSSYHPREVPRGRL